MSTALRSIPGGLQVGLELAGDAFGALVARFASAGVDYNELAAGVDDNRIVRRRHQVLWIECSLKRTIEIGARLVGQVAVGKLECVGAVGHDRDLDRADLIAVPTRRLIAGQRRGGMRGQRAERGRRRRCGCASEHIAAIELRHGTPPWKWSVNRPSLNCLNLKLRSPLIHPVGVC